MNREDWKRLLLHLPWGLLGALLQWWRVDYGITAVALIITYEGFNDWRKHDASYKDVLGIVWGYLIGGIAIWVLGG